MLRALQAILFAMAVSFATPAPAFADTAGGDGCGCGDCGKDCDSGCAHFGHFLSPASAVCVLVGLGLLFGERRRDRS